MYRHFSHFRLGTKFHVTITNKTLIHFVCIYLVVYYIDILHKAREKKLRFWSIDFWPGRRFFLEAQPKFFKSYEHQHSEMYADE